MDEVKAVECWTEGFVKAAAELGYQSPAQVNHLLKMCSHLTVMSKYPEAFEQGVVSVLSKQDVKTASITKQSLNPLVKYLGYGLGALLAGAGAANIYEKGRGFAEEHDLMGGGHDASDYYTKQMAPWQQKQLSRAAGVRRGQEAGKAHTQQMSDIMGNGGGSKGNVASFEPRTFYSPLPRFGVDAYPR